MSLYDAVRLTEEMTLLAAVCTPRPVPATIAGLVEAIDPGSFLKLARRHRVVGLVRHGFAATGVALPVAIAHAVADDARRVAYRGLALAAETARLCGALAGAKVPVVALKGAPLAMLAHGSLATKHAWDIDLLVPADRIEDAAQALAAAGYRCHIPGTAMVGLADWHRFAKDSAWRNDEADITVELHTELTENSRHLLPGLTARSTTRSVELSPGLTVPTFGHDALFAYLCVHGALSGWRRLKWLADLAGLVRDCDAMEIARLHGAAATLGAGRAASQAIALCARVFGTPLPPAVAAALADDWRTRLLVAGGLRLLTDPAGYDDPDERRFATLPIHLMTALLVPGGAYRRAEMTRRFRARPGGPRWLPVAAVRIARRLGWPCAQ